VTPTPFSDALVAIGGSKFKVVNNRDRNFTANKIDRYREQMEACIERKTLSAQRN
jgi:transposase